MKYGEMIYVSQPIGLTLEAKSKLLKKKEKKEKRYLWGMT